MCSSVYALWHSEEGKTLSTLQPGLFNEAVVAATAELGLTATVD